MINRIRIVAEFDNGNTSEVTFVCKNKGELATLFEDLKANAGQWFDGNEQEAK